MFPETHAEEDARFLGNEMDGALVTFVLIPGGSMFAGKRPILLPSSKPPVAKRGNMIFVKNGFTFVISTELAERVIEGTQYDRTPAQEDALLRGRLAAIAAKIQFTKPPAAP